MDNYNNFNPCTITAEMYWKKNGSKFEGTDEQLREKFTGCGHQMPWNDEEGWFDTFLCCKDFQRCDKECSKHHPKINEDIKEFFEHCCRMEKLK